MLCKSTGSDSTSMTNSSHKRWQLRIIEGYWSDFNKDAIRMPQKHSTEAKSWWHLGGLISNSTEQVTTMDQFSYHSNHIIVARGTHSYHAFNLMILLPLLTALYPTSHPANLRPPLSQLKIDSTLAQNFSVRLESCHQSPTLTGSRASWQSA